jgi:14-3-3 protein epsilon
MIKFMKKVCQSNQELSNDERNLLSVAYKNSVKPKRDAWRTIQAIQNKEEIKVSLTAETNKL